MISYDELANKSDKELLKFLSEQYGAQMASETGAAQSRNRELAKAILDNRSANITKAHNRIIICLTIVIAILTLILVYKAIFS